MADEADLVDRLLAGRVKAALFGDDHAPRLGRLVVLEPIGSGAMGAVFAAYDPTLDRKVAVKVLSGAGEQTNRDLLREARALGKLAHPNVVAVHDAGEVEGAVYLVMERVAGPSLGEWVETGPGWPAIAARLAEVAAGLHAAHAAGLVHADVKPANVLIGPARAQVVDFGLARALGAGGAPGGTPSYMAPEVLEGGDVTPAADQFAFAVMAFECLFGERPHRSKRLDGLAAAAREAAAVKRPADSDVPRWLFEAVRRGLAADPADRYPSMRAFAEALRIEGRRRRVVAPVAAIAGVAIAAAAMLWPRGEPDPCAGGEALMAEVWSEPVAADLASRLGGGRWAARAVERAGDLADRWRASHRRVCEATRVHGIQSDTLFDLRVRCLERQRGRLGALLAAIGDAPREPYRLATALADLGDPARCEAITGAELEAPADPDLVAALHRGEAAYALGRYREAGEIAEGLAGRDAPGSVSAEIALLRGAVEGRVGRRERARARLQAALVAAAGARAADLELDAWLRLLRDELFAGSRANVLEWAPFARAAAARARRPTAEIDGVVGEALRGLGRLDEARATLERALDEPSLIGERRALVEMNLGTVALRSGDPTGAEAAFVRARDLAAAALGADHPGLALYIDKIAIARRELGRVDEALELHDRALALREGAYGDSDRSVATTLLRRAETRIAAGRLDDAAADLDRAAAIRAAVYGAEHRRLADIERARGDVELARGDAAGAMAHYRRAAKLDPALPVAGRVARASEALSHMLGP